MSYNVYHYDEDAWWLSCEDCGTPKGESGKFYVSEPTSCFSPAYWCEDCMKELKCNVIGWVTEEDYRELRSEK